MIKHLICQECPNGCNLLIAWSDALRVTVSGNQCSRGIGYAGRILNRGQKVHVAARDKTPAFSTETLRDIVLAWGITLKKPRYDIGVQGSPERSVFRVAVEDTHQNLFVLERIFLKTLTQKRNIAKTLELLAERKLKLVHPYRRSVQHGHVVKHKNGFWQLSDFVPGIPLDRANYMFERWRGSWLAEFLIDLRRRSQDIPFVDAKKVFSLKDYIARLTRHAALDRPDIIARTAPVTDFLDKELWPFYDKVPASFCHGDYHPMNMIWGKKNISAVIDWEFCGSKSEIYDMANLIGCVGVEDPRALEGELVSGFIETIQSSRMISWQGFRCLGAFIVALRFAWLSEWLRRNDAEMIDLELEYLRVLIEKQPIFKETWIAGRR